MKKRLAILLLAVLFFGSALSAQDVAKPELRTWKDSTGSFSIQATFVRVNGDQVVLQGIDKKEISLPLAKLSAADQQYVKARLTPPGPDKKRDFSLFKTLTGHTGGVYSASFSPDGKLIVSAGGDNTPRIWDAKTGELFGTLAGHVRRVLCVAFSPDGKRIVSGSDDNTLKVWDVRTRKVLRTLTGHTGGVVSAAFSSDGKQIVTGSGDNKVKVWDANTGKLFGTLAGHVRAVRCVAFSPDGKQIVSCADNLKVWDAKTGKELWGYFDGTSAAFSPDGKQIVITGGFTMLQIVDANTGEILKTEKTKFAFQRATFSPDGKRVVGCGAGFEKTIKIVDAKTLELLETLIGHTDTVLSVAFSGDGKRIVSGSSDKTIKIWDASK